MNLPDVPPAAIVTDAGTVRLALLSDSVTRVPPAGAAPFKVMVQVVETPDEREVGIQAKALICTGAAVVLMMTVVDREIEFAATETMTFVVADTAPAEAAKVAVVLPAATVTEAGTVRAALLSEMATGSPPDGAALLRVRVHVPLELGRRVDGEQLKVEGTASAMRLREALAVVPLRLALSTAALSVDTRVIDAVKLAVEAPAGTVTEAGSVT